MRVLALVAALAVSCPVAAADYGIQGVSLGTNEATVRQQLPSAHCRPLEWKSEAADRRCDDSRVSVAGVDASVTVYLRRDAVQGIDLRFNTRDLERVVAHFKTLYGAPQSEGHETIVRGDRPPREVFTARWAAGIDSALLSSQPERKRSAISVWRGDFAQELYRTN
jgi:hypothetical protein